MYRRCTLAICQDVSNGNSNVTNCRRVRLDQRSELKIRLQETVKSLTLLISYYVGHCTYHR